MRDGYLTAGMKPWALARCRPDEAAFDSFVRSTGPVFAISRTGALSPLGMRPGVADSPVAPAICERPGLKPGSLSG